MEWLEGQVALVRGGVQTDLRGLAALGQSGQSHWAAPGIDWEERLRAGSPL
jgi:hypothetical protein